MTIAAEPRRRSDYSLTGPRAGRAVEAGLADARWYVTPVPRDAMRALLQRRDGPAMRDTLLWFALLLITGAAAAALWPTAWAILPFALYGILFASVSDSRWHECGHGTAFKTDWLNNAVYEIGSFMDSASPSCGAGATPAITATRSSPAGIARSARCGPSPSPASCSSSSTSRMCSSFKQCCPACCGRMIAADERHLHARIRARAALTARPGLPAHLRGDRSSRRGRGQPSPADVRRPALLLGALAVDRLRIQQHAGLAEDVLDHRLNTRTVYLNRISKYLYWNMGYHIEHHMFPMVPYYNLDRLHALVKWDMPRPYCGLLDAYREVIPALIRQSKDGAYYIRRAVPAAAANPAAPAATAETFTSSAEPDAEGWVAVCELDRLVPGDVLRFEHVSSADGDSPAGGASAAYAIYRTFDGRLYASAARCTHANAQLTDGFLQGVCIECPKHNGRFDIRDGAVRRPPPRAPLQTYPICERAGTVYLQVRTS
jgi:Na+-transporting NADH:ubiquinone oxidoreductase subunit F